MGGSSYSYYSGKSSLIIANDIHVVCTGGGGVWSIQLSTSTIYSVLCTVQLQLFVSCRLSLILPQECIWISVLIL